MTTTITNFGIVSPHIFRGAQPDSLQYQELQDLKVTTVLDLREDICREKEAINCAAFGMRHVSCPIGNQFVPIIGQIGILPPTQEQLKETMTILEDPSQITFVHCAHGEDRTGVIIACYRMIHDGWSNQEAMNEALKYHINPLQILIKQFIETFRG